MKHSPQYYIPPRSHSIRGILDHARIYRPPYYAFSPLLDRRVFKIADRVGGLTEREQYIVSAMLNQTTIFAVDGHRINLETSRAADLITLNPGGLLILLAWDAPNQEYTSWVVARSVNGAEGVKLLGTLADELTHLLMQQGADQLIAEGGDPQTISEATWGFPINIRILAEEITGSAIGLLPEWDGAK